MKKTVQLSRSAIVLALIALTGCPPSNKPTADNADCRAKMSEETTAYIKEMKTPFKGADAEFYANKDEQVYLLNSEEPVKLNSKESLKNTVAIVNHKDARGKNSFYLIEQEITADKIIFVLSEDSKVLESLPVKLISPRASIPGPGGPDQGACQSYCDSVEANNDAQLQLLFAEANQTCSPRSICLPLCNCFGGVPSIAWAIHLVRPTSWRCWRNIAVEYYDVHFFALRNPGPFLDQAFDIAIKKEARLYTY